MKNNTSFKNGHNSSLFKDETGMVYGKLTVIKRAENSKFNTAIWLCKCDCGNEKKANANTLRNGKTKCCGCSRKNGKQRSGDAIYKRAMRATKNDCIKRGIIFNLTLDNFKILMSGNCYYCTQPPYIKKFAYHRNLNDDESLYLNGIDRKAPKLGYVIGNVVSCCKYCNRAKSDLSVSEFKKLITKIYNNLLNIK